jgi:dipeptidyl aminopeptidase/acylaminoacyl peptidase
MVTIQGFIVKPIDFDPAKNTLLFYGFMAVQQVNMTFLLIALPSFMASGYVVLLINPRGSTGYGQDFCKAIYADWGNLDYQDVMAGDSIAQGYTDPDKQ